MSMVQKFTAPRRALGAVVALALTATSLSGCVYYPSNGYYAGGYYAPAPVVVQPGPVVVGGYWGGGGCWGCGWGGGWHHDRGWR